MKCLNVSYGLLVASFLLVMEGKVGEEEGGSCPD